MLCPSLYFSSHDETSRSSSVARTLPSTPNRFADARAMEQICRVRLASPDGPRCVSCQLHGFERAYGHSTTHPLLRGRGEQCARSAPARRYDRFPKPNDPAGSSQRCPKMSRRREHASYVR
nr:hypothetical protein CFP56_41301 [Quercus suber]